MQNNVRATNGKKAREHTPVPSFPPSRNQQMCGMKLWRIRVNFESNFKLVARRMVLPLWGLISWGATVASKQQSHWGKRQKSTLLFSRAQLMDRRTPKRNRSASWGLRDADRLRRPSLCLVKVSFCEGDNIGGLTMRLVSATPFHLLHIVGWKQVAHAQKWRRAGQLPRVNFSSDYCRHSRGMWSPYLSVPYGSSLQKLFERNLRKARPSSWKRCEPFFFFFPSK